MLFVLQGSQEMLVDLLLSVLIHQVYIEDWGDIFSCRDVLSCAELESVLFVSEHLLGLILALG